MTTDEATRYLGEVLEFGGGDDDADLLLWGAVREAKKCNWRICEALLARAYKSLGAKPPEVEPVGGAAFAHPGYAFYAGEHPIQYAAVQAAREMDAWLDPPRPPKPKAPPRHGPPSPPGTYQTAYSLFVGAIAAAEKPDATMEALDTARQAFASRADRLSRKRGNRAEVDRLHKQYDQVVQRMLSMGWK